MAPAATASPAEAAVMTMLFSRIVPPRSIRSTPMDTTAAGIEAETVMVA